MENKKIALLLGALILVVGCLGNKNDIEEQSTTQTTIKEEVSPHLKHFENNTYTQVQIPGMGDRTERFKEIREKLGLPENATEEEVRESLEEMGWVEGRPPFNDTIGRPPFNDTIKKHVGGV